MEILAAKLTTIEGRESLTLDILIDGKRTSVGGINPSLTKSEILAYLEANRARILAEAPQPSSFNPDNYITLSPQSLHIAALTAVDVANKKATVARKWMGQNYTYTGCYCSAQALAEYQAGRLKLFNPAYGINAPENADSFVLVYFVSENPYDEAIEIPVIIDKLVK